MMAEVRDLPLARNGLDFIVFGIARSGTTAVTREMSKAPGVFCMNEAVYHSDDHQDFHALEFLDMMKERKNSPSRNKNSLQALADLRAQTAPIEVLGNKYPRYYLALDRIFAELGHSRSVCCLRETAAVMASYNGRAAEAVAWPAGRVGCYAGAELIVLIHALARNCQHDILMCPHRALVSSPVKTMQHVMGHVTSGSDQAFAAAPPDEAPRSFAERPQLSAVEQELEQVLAGAGVAELYEQDAPYLLSDKANAIQAISAKLPADPREILRAALERTENPEATAHYEQWERMVIDDA